jgi:uncharacterized membrane protein
MLRLYHALMWAGSFWCHQMPERSPHLIGIQMPLCWRCTGIAIGAMLLLCWAIKRKQLPRLAVSIALACVLPLDVLGAMFGLWRGENTVRFITGLLWGFFATSAFLRLLAVISARIFTGRNRCRLATEG